jgi:hypothetical protein
MPMNNRILRPLARPLLLDAVPGAAAAYSLRQLSNAYTGPVVTVRRSSDDAEADFKASEIEDGTLTAFCGAGDGLVKTWHDQSGNTGIGASQGTAASQPKIVSSGSLVTDGGKAALEFDGTDDFLEQDFAVSTLGLSTAYVYRSVGTTGNRRVYEVADPTGEVNTLYAAEGFASGGKMVGYRLPENLPVENTLPADTLATLGFYVRKSTTLQTAAYNGVVNSRSGTTTTFVSDVLRIGITGAITSTCFDGYIFELIIYPSDQSANRQLVEGNLAWYY